MPDPRRTAPSVGRILSEPAVADACARLGPAFVKGFVTDAIERCRSGELSPDAVTATVLATLPAAPTHLRRVINATGIIVHTNLGRAPLSAGARAALVAAAAATDVEFDLVTGRRGRRGDEAVRALLRAAPSAQDAMVTNNGAAALMLVSRVLADGRNIVLSRGEMVEIGDGFRIPELVQASGAEIREVGTTNRTNLDDYLDAIDGDTAFVLKVHPSNFAVQGFTAHVTIRELAAHIDLPVVADVGSGLLTRHRRLPREPDVTTALSDGAALVIASGDKLLGGPQCGLLLGDRSLVHRLRRHPLARAVRVDKLTLAALEATIDGPTPPVRQALSASPDEIVARVEHVLARVGSADAPGITIRARTTRAAVGGGGAPTERLDSAGIALPERFAAALRAGDPPVIGHVDRGEVVLDLIAVDPDDDDTVADAIVRAAKRLDERSA